MEMEENRSHWSLDKRVPIALIVTMILQVFAAGVFMASLQSTQTQHERRISQNEVEIKAQSLVSQKAGNDLTRLQVQNENILEAVRRVERVLVPRRPGE